MSRKTAIIIGAGPAGLTAAYELLKQTDIKPVVFEATTEIGGISKTVHYKGNRIDIGGHRFFSKSDRVMTWWTSIFPPQESPDGRKIDPETTNRVMLIRRRLSRIYFLRKFFNYPITLSLETCRNLGLVRLMKIGISYILAMLFKIKPERSLQDFFINRFGRELYNTFFKDYTQKVWGVPCSAISPEWGGQRVKGLSFTKAIGHALKKIFRRDKDIAQKTVETSLIERFLYPKLGPGQMWEEVAGLIQEKGGEVRIGKKVVGLNADGNRLTSVIIEDVRTKIRETVSANYVFSSMPVRDLVAGLNAAVPEDVKTIADGLIYRDFMTVGLLLNRLQIKNNTQTMTRNNLIPDNWIYIQERDVKLGRLQIFNNWSPYMVADPDKVWIGLEYFCNEGDELWAMPDAEFSRFAVKELASINIIDERDVLDSVVIRVPKTYPAYFGSYKQFPRVRAFLDAFENLFLIGRNGMHRYNNQDHSMLSAIAAVENIRNGVVTKDNIWAVNAEEEYHETKTPLKNNAGNIVILREP